MFDSLKKLIGKNEPKHLTYAEKEALLDKAEKDKPKVPWKDDHEQLRKLIKVPGISGEYATLLYTLISHMRGKLHMRSYKLKTSGWRGFHTETTREIPQKQMKLLTTLYGELAKFYYNRAAIETLEDQAEWIKKHMQYTNVQEIAERILTNNYMSETSEINKAG